MLKIFNLSLTNFLTHSATEVECVHPLSVFVGENGSGKSSLLTALAFLRAMLRDDAVVVGKQVRFGGEKGWAGLVRGTDSPGFNIFLGLIPTLPLSLENRQYLTYQLALASVGVIEFLEQVDDINEERRAPALENNLGKVLVAKDINGTFVEEHEALKSPWESALPKFAAFEGYDLTNQVLSILDSFRIFEPSVEKMRRSAAHIGETRLSPDGSNLAGVLHNLSQTHDDTFAKINKRLADFFPAIQSVEVQLAPDGLAYLGFMETGRENIVTAREASDGTIKMLGYLTLLYDPDPQPLLAIEEPEHHIHHSHLQELAEEFRIYAERGGQMLVTTHSPEFLNAIRPEELQIVEKADGVSTVRAAFNDPEIVAEYEAGNLLGSMWRSGAF